MAPLTTTTLEDAVLGELHLLSEYEGHKFAVASMPPFDVAKAPFNGTPYPCLLWDHVGGISFDDKSQLARSLIRNGCRYAVCAGCECDDWEEAFDWAFLEEYGFLEEEWADTFVMTTSHRGEPPDEVAFFFVMCTNFEDEFRAYLVLHIGIGPEAAAIEAAVVHYSRLTATETPPPYRP